MVWSALDAGTSVGYAVSEAASFFIALRDMSAQNVTRLKYRYWADIGYRCGKGGGEYWGHFFREQGAGCRRAGGPGRGEWHQGCRKGVSWVAA